MHQRGKVGKILKNNFLDGESSQNNQLTPPIGSISYPITQDVSASANQNNLDSSEINIGTNVLCSQIATLDSNNFVAAPS